MSVGSSVRCQMGFQIRSENRFGAKHSFRKDRPHASFQPCRLDPFQDRQNPVTAFVPLCGHLCASSPPAKARIRNHHCLAAFPLASRPRLLAAHSPTTEFKPPGSAHDPGTGHHTGLVVVPGLAIRIESLVPSVSGVTRSTVLYVPWSPRVILSRRAGRRTISPYENRSSGYRLAECQQRQCSPGRAARLKGFLRASDC